VVVAIKGGENDVWQANHATASSSTRPRLIHRGRSKPNFRLSASLLKAPSEILYRALRPWTRAVSSSSARISAMNPVMISARVARFAPRRTTHEH
jgi:hypothetical protein